MKTQPIVPASIERTPEGVPYAREFGDVYHASAGAHAQAQHVFLGGNGLPGRWSGRDRFTILETGFGLGNNFLATWKAWRADPNRSERLYFVSIEKHPPRLDDLRQAHALSPTPDLAAALIDQWPLLTPNLHGLAFDDARVHLLLAFGDVADLLAQLRLEADAFFLDGFAPARNPDMWAPRTLERLGRLAAPGATAATWSAARVVRDGLRAAGFEVQEAPGFAGKRDMTVARHAPRYRPAAPPGGVLTPACEREAVIVGAGLAGSAAAWALAQHGWRSVVLDAGARPAERTSGNAAGLFHGVFHTDDGPHARAHRAAALQAQRQIAPWLAEARMEGACDGLLRLDARIGDDEARAALSTQGMPPEFLHWLPRDEARERSGMQLPSGGWWYESGGWVAPADYCRALIETSGCSFKGEARVERIERIDGRWHLFDAQGLTLACAPVVVLANAHDARRLSGDTLPALGSVRGQITGLPVARAGGAIARVPVSGAGYVLPPHEGVVWCGSTSDHDDADGTLRAADHARNLAQLQRLCGTPIDVASSDLQGRVGWRAVTRDRLPLIGAVGREPPSEPARGAALQRLPRQRDAQGGLYVYAGLGSRGITWAAWGAQVLAAWIAGVPSIAELDLHQALDPLRPSAPASRA